MGKGQPLKKARKHLSADALFRNIYAGFKKVPDGQPADASISLADALMSGFALFALKDASLLAFDQRRQGDPQNLRMIFHIQNVPCDTQMRTILDRVSPEALRPVFRDVFAKLQRGKVLERLTFVDGYYLLALDGTGYFSSEKVHCQSCMQKTSRNGKTTYYHQMLGAAIVHPDFKEVVPLMPEPIIKQDGQTKNDCERNAAKRFFEHFRADHPHLPVIVVEDALSSNAPHIRECQHHNLRFLLGVKEGDHAFLFQHVRALRERGAVEEFEVLDEASGVRHRYLIGQQLPLNESNADLLVNFLEYWEIHPDGRTQHFSWVTDLSLDRERAPQVVRGGRARWKIENETFNTLKNQGYQFEHNFGHGKQNLSVVFGMLMMLAFLVDQTQQLCCPLFRAVWEKLGSKKMLWERMRSLFRDFTVSSMREIWEALFHGYEKPRPVFSSDSS